MNHNLKPSSLHTEVIELTKELIRIPSTHSRKHEISRCADFIQNWLENEQIPCSRRDIDGVPSVVVLPGKGKTQVLLMSHFDVVEVEDQSLFTPIEKDDRLFGRGAIDDKYAVAVSLILFREHLGRLRRDGYSLSDMCFGLLFTGDEEIGGSNGAGKLCEEIDTDFFIAIDGGNLDKIVCKEKGVLQLQLNTTGKAAHGARPWLGESAFEILVEDHRKIQELFPADRSDRWHATAVLSNCHVGNGSPNCVPDKALATLDIRYTDRDDPDMLLAAIRKAVRSEVTVNSHAPVFTSGNSSYIDLLVRHTSGAELGFEHGASDARFLSERGIPGVVFGADGEMSQHTEHEHITLASLRQFYDLMDGYLLDIALQMRGR